MLFHISFSLISFNLFQNVSNDDVDSDIKVQLYPKEPWTPNVAWLQTLAAIYLVLAYSPFVNFLTVALVTEKEKKIRDAMRMMGLRDSAFW